jgi:DNA-directed RNA polymerase subunit beta'
MTKKEVTNVIDYVYRHCGQKDTVIFCDQLMAMGFKHACTAGISFGISDLETPKAKADLMSKAEKQVKDFEQQYQDGLITQGEKYNKVVDKWSKCSDDVAAEMMKNISTIKVGEPVNSVWMMAHSGARGSADQIKQIAGMRGLMAKPSGEIIETPIKSSFKDGLNVLEYFNAQEKGSQILH